MKHRHKLKNNQQPPMALNSDEKHLSHVAKKEVELEKLRQYMMNGNQKQPCLIPGQKQHK